MKTIILSLMLIVTCVINAENLTISSTDQQTELIELYTSQGCSSCPPADQWLSSLKKDDGLFENFVPVGFHVDYWDYIGWKDNFATAYASKRQQRYKSVGNLNSVYTPGVLKSGKEWRSWRYNYTINKIFKTVGTLSLKILDNQLSAQFSTDKKYADLKLHVALLGMNISTKVRAGENKNKLLKHDFIVLKHRTFNSHSLQWNAHISPDFFSSQHKDLAFVAWIEEKSNPTPIQAVGTLL